MDWGLVGAWVQILQPVGFLVLAGHVRDRTRVHRRSENAGSSHLGRPPGLRTTVVGHLLRRVSESDAISAEAEGCRAETF